MRIRCVTCNSQKLPFFDIIVGVIGEILLIVRVACQTSDDRHGLDTDDSLQGEVGLIPRDAISLAREATIRQ
jgi:hypothetical protein